MYLALKLGLKVVLTKIYCECNQTLKLETNKKKQINK